MRWWHKWMKPVSSSSSIESILEKEGFYLFTGSGNSMWPLIRDGIDTIEVRPVRGSLSAGDVVLFRDAQDKYVLHRIIEVKDGIYLLRGDNTYAPDLVPKERIIGIMTGLWRAEKKIPLNSFKYAFYTKLFLKCPLLFRILKSKIWR